MSLFSKDEKKTQGTIITDDISSSPILDFNDYVTALTKIIKNSDPKFSIGIYGEWGTGKTTLMRSIYNTLTENNENKSIIPVWFNAWRYEREEQFAIIPLLKTIAFAIP
jgi:predicted KAP-like P-loop ATPase